MSSPRHHYVTCSRKCGFNGMRVADSPKEALKTKCPRCGASVREGNKK